MVIDQKLSELPAGKGDAITLRQGETLFLQNTYGSQVVDTWALSLDDPTEYLSVEHTRRMNGHLYTKAGETFWSNRRTPMLLLSEDSFPGTHDMLVACCDPWVYAHLGAKPGHANCRDNFLGALRPLGVEPPQVPNPVNLWMNVPVTGDEMDITPPLSRPGDHVRLLAEIDVIVILSTCPMDIVPINGEDCMPRAVHYAIEAG